MSDISYVKRLNSAGGGAQIPRRLIIHSISEFIRDGVRDWWAPDFLEHIKLSAHYFVCPSGVVIQARNDHQIAYHAKDNNTATVGVEFMVPGVYDYSRFVERIKTSYLTGPQWEAGIELCRQLHQRHHFGDIQRHSDIDPDRKVDPGDGFPWEEFVKRVEP